MFQTFVGIDDYACLLISATRPCGYTTGPASSVVQCSESPIVVVAAAEAEARSEDGLSPHLIFDLAVGLAPVAVAHATAGKVPFRSFRIEDQELELGVFVVLTDVGDREHPADAGEAVVVELSVLVAEAEGDGDAVGAAIDDALVETVAHHLGVWQGYHRWLARGSRLAYQLER